MGKLTAITVKNLTQPGRHSDGSGLYLFVDGRGGHKSWVLRFTVDGRRVDRGLGGYPSVSLAEARRKAEGVNPAKAKAEATPKPVKKGKIRKSTVATFQEMALQVHAQGAETWTNRKTVANWWQRCQRYILPEIGNTPVDEITRVEVLRILAPIWTAKPETGRRIRRIIKDTMAFAMAYGLLPSMMNPAGEVINAALRPQAQVKAHHLALPAESVADAITTVENSTAFEATKLAFKFLVLTATRANETLNAEWAEIDLGNATWTIPAKRMKSRQAHRVALSSGALAVLEQAAAIRRDGCPLIFVNERTPSKPLSDMALSMLLKRIGYKGLGVPHGFRTSFRTWADDFTDHDFAVKELALAHTIGNAVVAAYSRSDLLERRRALMQDWSDFLALA